MSLLNKLFKLANHFDQLGLTEEASVLDRIILKLAMSFNEARTLLGVGQNATKDEIQSAWKRKALEFHPDRGGDLEKMKAVNVARDLLLGERKPEEPRPPPPKSPFRTAPAEPVIKSWEEAAKTINIPEGAKWRFKTATASDSVGMSGRATAFVVCGATDESHVFVGVYHFYEHNIAGLKDVYEMWADTYPKSVKLADLAPTAIRKIWAKFPDVKDYNAKVELLSDTIEFNKRMTHSGSRVISFKDAMEILGETPTTWKPSKKIDVIIELDYPPIGGHLGEFVVTLVVNGRPFSLSEESNKMISNARKLLRALFGTYYSGGSKKNITRQPGDKRKVILNFLAEKLADKEPKELIEALKLAAEQTK